MLTKKAGGETPPGFFYACCGDDISARQNPPVPDYKLCRLIRATSRDGRKALAGPQGSSLPSALER